MAALLARSMKEHERRAGDGLGFSLDSGDCLAFKYYRDVRRLLRLGAQPLRMSVQLWHLCMLSPAHAALV